MTDDNDDAEVTWMPVMPFVVCKSQGGPYDDDSFVAGWELGRLDAELPHYAALGFGSITKLAHSATRPQIDLVAMKHGWRVAHHSEDRDGWITVDLTLVTDD